ncbi:o-succinylbenzoate synthase [Actinoplanes sp. GCM10030250]|uniref:o-succinylbenzoate synthase n=1 Tax=Actinoplanes sp. GCM10030250 TaxID=3273376 RepID=UPI003612EA2F
MRVESIELRVVRLPLVAPFRTSFMTEYHRDALLVCVRTPEGVEGWGECVAMQEPCFSAEYLNAAVDVMRRFLIPLIQDLPEVTAEDAASAFTAIKGHLMAKAALETAILDAELQLAGVSLASRLGAEHDIVPAGVSVGIMDSVPELLDAVEGYLESGYQRIKLKIQRDWDEKPVRQVRERFGDHVPLQVDANGAYTWDDLDDLVRLDEYNLLMIEQPFPYDDLWGHVLLSRRLAKGTPVCLDESVTSPAEAITAIKMGAASIINIKPGRVGGYLAAKQIHDVCAEHGAQVWVGGMLETGIGRAANLALAALPNFTLVGDLSASDRFFQQDVTPPFIMKDGHIAVPGEPGIGVRPYPDILERAAREVPPIAIPVGKGAPHDAVCPHEAPWLGFPAPEPQAGSAHGQEPVQAGARGAGFAVQPDARDADAVAQPAARDAGSVAQPAARDAGSVVQPAARKAELAADNGTAAVAPDRGKASASLAPLL